MRDEEKSKGDEFEEFVVRPSDRLCEMLGYTRDELVGKSARMLYPSDEDYEYVGGEKYAKIAEMGT